MRISHFLIPFVRSLIVNEDGTNVLVLNFLAGLRQPYLLFDISESNMLAHSFKYLLLNFITIKGRNTVSNISFCNL